MPPPWLLPSFGVLLVLTRLSQVHGRRPLWTQWLSLLKLLRVQRLNRVRARERHRAHEAGKMPRNIVVEKTSDIGKLLLAFIMWAHLCGCLCAPRTSHRGMHAIHTLVHLMLDSCRCCLRVDCFIGRIQPIPEHGGKGAIPWLVQLHQDDTNIIDENSVVAVYIIALHWAMATALTTGVSGVTALTSVEQIFCVLMMLMSSLLYACIFGQVTTLVESLDQINRRYQSELHRFTEFASIYRLPLSLRGRMYAHVHYNWQISRGINVDTVIDSLPGAMRRDIQMFLLSSIVANFPIFANTPSNFIGAVVEKFRTELLVANEYVFTADEPGRHLYIIHIGRVEVITPEGVVVGKLSDGAYFGEIAILADVRRTSSIRTVCRCHFYKLSKEDFNEVLEGFPELRGRIAAKAMTRLQKTIRVRSKTSLCGAVGADGSKAVASLAARSVGDSAMAAHCKRDKCDTARGVPMESEGGAREAKASVDNEIAPLPVLADGIVHTRQAWHERLDSAIRAVTSPVEARARLDSFEELSTHNSPQCLDEAPTTPSTAEIISERLMARIESLDEKVSQLLMDKEHG